MSYYLFPIGKRSLEEHFPHHNWFIVIAFQLLLSTIFSVMNPSIYQFVTSPSTIPEELKNNEVHTIREIIMVFVVHIDIIVKSRPFHLSTK